MKETKSKGRIGCYLQITEGLESQSVFSSSLERERKSCADQIYPFKDKRQLRSTDKFAIKFQKEFDTLTEV
jgi:hypothetical protein